MTSFFRDPDAWRILNTQVIAPLVRAKESDAPIRVWCAGCATGEEPYSLGMLLLEQLAAQQKSCSVQIFATDVDDKSLDVARQAVYPESIAADVSPERLSRFFMRVSESSYQVSKQLRETVVFAHQNLIADAPFSKLDLVVCRNLLIYLEQEVQQKIVNLLHFALGEEGVLFLGSSETIGRGIDLFEPLSAKWRIYRRIGPSRPSSVRYPVAHAEPRLPKAAPSAGMPAVPPRLPELAQNFLLRRFALACVVINRNYEVLHFAGPTEDYLIQPGGPPTQDLLSLARPGLDTKLRVVVQRAIRENSAQRIKDVMMRHDNVSRRVNIDVEPLSHSKQTEGLLLIAFQEQPSPAGETLAEAKARTQTAESDLMRQLEQELESTREDLQSTIEELESSNEEMKASNEEIMSMNEELQSANEELETSKEELQSLNEELSTVNNQLQDKVQDLETANNDITNLFNCTDIASVFLDSALRIRRFTPASTGLFKVIATDVGRPIGDIVKNFRDDDLLPDAQEVQRDLVPREREVLSEQGRWCVRRIIPYRTLDNRIDGVVLTFVDVTERKLAADATLWDREQRLQAILDTAADAIVTINECGTIQSVNPAAVRLFGYAAAEMVGQNVKVLMPSPYREAHDTYLAKYLETGVKKIIGVGREVEARRKDGSIFPVDLAVSQIDHLGLFTGIIRDITRRKELEREVLEIASLEQQRIGQDLHDSVGQELTALNIVVGDLAETLRSDPQKASVLVEKLTVSLQRTQTELRAVLRGLLPVAVDSEGLMASLADLANRVQQEGRASCRFECPEAVFIGDNLVATNLYLVAQEAVHNALKHAQPHHIQISLYANDYLNLRVQDDGIGIGAGAIQAPGLGLRIMRNRAAIIGAVLTIEPAQPTGTLVACTVPRREYEREKSETARPRADRR